LNRIEACYIIMVIIINRVKSIILPVALLLTVVSHSADGQWSIMLSKSSRLSAANNQFTFGGAVNFKDGIIWAGVADGLVFSTDTGKTWANANDAGAWITDVSFANRDTGIIEGIGRTTDGGQSWQSPAVCGGWRCSFVGSGPLVYALGTSNPIGIDISTDYGQTWNFVGFGFKGSESSSFAVAIDGTLYAQQFNFSHNGQIFMSTDSGKSWEQTTGLYSDDAWSIDADSCDASRLYITDENSVGDYSPFTSQIFISTDGGGSWTSTFSQPVPYLTGSFTSSLNAMYVGTFANGILRSTDHGLSWKSIGGPGISNDSRLVCAINDNIIFAVDPEGNIWATFNSGGDSVIAPSGVEPLSISPSPLSISGSSCDTIMSSVIVSALGCNSTIVTSSSIIGPDSSSFSLDSGVLLGGLIPVTFHGTQPGQYNAELVLQLSDGTFDTVPIIGNASGAFIINLITSNEETHTIGGDVYVPITISGIDQPENVNLVMHYDTVLQYDGSKNLAGVSLDIPGQQWAGRTELNIDPAEPGALVGYAHFNVFVDNDTSPQVTFDSLDILRAYSPCEYTLPAPAISIITTGCMCGATSCGEITLSKFLLDGKIPLGIESIVPNPATDAVQISFVNSATSPISYQIIDALGETRLNGAASSNSLSLDVSCLPQGVYFFRATNANGFSVSSKVAIVR
jgi:photosystem II stability/assembly factor-like uncharacterized protein